MYRGYGFVTIRNQRVQSMADRPQVSRRYVNKGIDSLDFWKAIPFVGTKHLKSVAPGHTCRASLRKQRRLQFRKQKMWSTRGCVCRTVTEKFSWPVLYSYVNVSSPVLRDFILSSRTICARADFDANRPIIASWHSFFANEFHVTLFSYSVSTFLHQFYDTLENNLIW